MEFALLAAGGVLLLVALTRVAFVVRRRAQPAAGTQPSPTAGITVVAENAAATGILDLDAPDPDAPAIRRLAADAAERLFAQMPGAAQVVISARSGAVLGRFVRRGTTVPGRGASFSAPPRTLRPNAPSLSSHLSQELTDEEPATPYALPAQPSAERPAPRSIVLEPEPMRPLAESFDLPPSVRRNLGPSSGAVEIVQAILEAAGRRVTRDGDVLRSGDEIVIVLASEIGRAVDHDALNHAYYRFTWSGAARGLVLTPGYIGFGEIRRRELLVPNLRHAGADGIQRMADAVAAGGDPLAFATGAPLSPTRA